MEKTKIEALRKLGLTKDEAREWIDILFEESTVKTPMAIVYKNKDDSLDALPYLDKTRKEDVVGVLENDVIWFLTGQKSNVLYHEAKNLVTEKSRFPSVAQLERVCSRLPAINQTFDILRKYGIKAEDFLEHGHYWTSQQWSINDKDTVIVYSIKDKSKYEFDPFRGKLAHARVCMPFYTY